MSDRIEELEARLAEVTKERDAAKNMAYHAAVWAAACNKARVEAAKAAEAADAKLAEVTAERDEARDENRWQYIQAAFDDNASDAEDAHLRFYREGIKAGADRAETRWKDWTGQSGVSCDVTACKEIAKAIRALPDPTDEQMDAIRKGGE
jgi:hypothetical protein